MQRARVIILVALPCIASAQVTTVGPRAAPTLGQILERALARHPLVRAAEERVRGQRGSRVTAGAWTNPMLEYQVENAAYPGRPAPPGVDRELMTSLMVPLDPLY